MEEEKLELITEIMDILREQISDDSELSKKFSHLYELEVETLKLLKEGITEKSKNETN